MQKVSAFQGKFEIDLGDKETENRIVSASCHCRADEAGSFFLTVAQDPVILKKKQTNKLPQKLRFKWLEKGLFQGSLSQVVIQDHYQMTLIYRDALAKLEKIQESGFVKQQNLQEYLSKSCKKTGLQAKFQGDFSDPLPAFNATHKPLSIILRTLANDYGFYLVTRSFAGDLHFIRAGKNLGSANVDCQEKVSGVSIEQSSDHSFKEIKLAYFDAENLTPKKSELSENDAKSFLGNFTAHATYSEKKNWDFAQGSIETLATDQFHFKNAKQQLKGALSKSIMSQEQVRLNCFEPLGQPGDKISLSKSPAPAIQEGDYFVHSLSVELNSNIPRGEILAIRP